MDRLGDQNGRDGGEADPGRIRRELKGRGNEMTQGGKKRSNTRILKKVSIVIKQKSLTNGKWRKEGERGGNR